MKTCPNCQTRNFDVDSNCGKCGYPLKVDKFETVVTFPTSTPQPSFHVVNNNTLSNYGMRIAAKIFMILSCVSFVISFLAVCVYWILALAADAPASMLIILFIVTFVNFVGVIIAISMTSTYSRKTAYGEKISVGFKICTLLFVSLIAGILMLCDSDK